MSVAFQYDTHICINHTWTSINMQSIQVHRISPTQIDFEVPQCSNIQMHAIPKTSPFTVCGFPYCLFMECYQLLVQRYMRMSSPAGVGPDTRLSGRSTHYNRQWHAMMCHSHLYNDTLVIRTAYTSTGPWHLKDRTIQSLMTF